MESAELLELLGLLEVWEVDGGGRASQGWEMGRRKGELVKGQRVERRVKIAEGGGDPIVDEAGRDFSDWRIFLSLYNPLK